MDIMEVIHWMEQLPLLWGLVVLGISAAIEYVFPPFPGDTVTLAGAFMVGAVGWPWWAVLLALVCGSVVGISVDWKAGVWLEHSEQNTWLHRVLERPNMKDAVTRTKEKFQRHGSYFIVANRFLPAFRSVFFLVSGMAGLKLSKVLFFGLLSVLLWSGLILVLGGVAGMHVEQIVTWMKHSGMIIWVIVLVGLVVWFGKAPLKKWIAKRSAR